MEIRLKNLVKTYEGGAHGSEINAVRGISLTVPSNTIFGIIGKSGAGKSTLVRLISLLEKPDSGEVFWGQTTSYSYLPRDTNKYFENDLTITEWLKQYSKEQDDAYVRGFLGRMLFSGDESLKPVKVLSGGEKVRCMLSKMMLQNANVLIFDDPTNHLDLEAIESLNNALEDFPGVVLFNSHDHEFISSIANRIVEITPNGVIDRMMNFDDYIADDTVTELRKKYYEGTGKKIKYRV